MTNLQVLMLIATFLAFTFGSFVWYVATWDQRETARSFILVDKFSPKARHTATGGDA